MGSCTSKEEIISRSVATTGYRQVITKDMEISRFIKNDKQDLEICKSLYEVQIKDCEVSKEDILELIYEIKTLEEIIKLEEELLNVLTKSKEKFIEENLDNKYILAIKSILDDRHLLINILEDNKFIEESQINLLETISEKDCDGSSYEEKESEYNLEDRHTKFLHQPEIDLLPEIIERLNNDSDDEINTILSVD